MVVLLTKTGYDSRYVHQEIGFAKRDGKIVVLVVTAEIAHEDLGMFGGIEYILVDEAGPSDAVRTLNARIEQLAREKSRDEALTLVLAMVAVGVIIMALRE